MANILFEGKTVTINKEEYILPTLGGKAYRVGNAFEKIGKIEAAIGRMEELGKLTLTSEEIGYMYDLVLYALQRNYPDLTVDFVEDSMGLDDVMDLFPFLVSQDEEKKKKGLEMVAAKNAQKQTTKKK